MGDADGDLPRISVVNFHGYWFSLDNRRLFVLQKAYDVDTQVEVWERDVRHHDSDPEILVHHLIV